MILIVDDRPENVFSLKSILELHSFPVDTAFSGEDALRKVLKQKYSLIILDVQMPEMDGFEVAEFLSGNSHTREIPLIFLSAVNTEKRFITKGYSSGAIDYIVKPIDTDILLLKVKTFHRLYEQNRELVLIQEKLESEIEFRKKAQQQMQEKAQELHGVLRSLPQVAFTATAKGDIDFVNERWFGYSDSAVVFPVTHPDDQPISDSWKQMIQAGEPLEREVRLKKYFGMDFRYHLLRVVPVKEEDTIVKWVGSFTDIEEQKKVIEQKDIFLSIASHELKTPLTSIKGYVQLLEGVIDKDEQAKKFAERTLVQVNKLDDLINDLLDISKIESGKLKFDLEPIEFDNMLCSALDMLQHIYPSTKIIWEKKTGARIMGNQSRLEQVVINFISNAVKYSPKNTPVEVITEINERGELYVGVKDEGIGISAENQERIFGKFYRVSEGSATVSGLGIGLYICSEILLRHNAAFGVISEPGEGSVFYFTIPIIQKK